MPNLNVRFLNSCFTPISSNKPDTKLIVDLLAESHTTRNEASRLVLTWMALRHLFAVPYDDPRYKEFLPLWEAALCEWVSAAAWYGLHEPHPLSQLAAINTLIWIRERSKNEGDPRSIHGTRGALASAYYSLAKMNRPRHVRRQLLTMALCEVNTAIANNSTDLSGLYAIRGSIHCAIGKRWWGLNDFIAMLKLRQEAADTDERIGEAEVGVGMGYARVGRLLKARQYINTGVKRLENSDQHTFTVQALRKLAILQLITLHPVAATRTLERAMKIARSSEMHGQLMQLDKMFRFLRYLNWRYWCAKPPFL